MTPQPEIYWYWYITKTLDSTAKSVDELLEWTEVLFDFDNVLKHHLPELRGHWIENHSLLTGVPRNINILSTTVSFPRFLGNFIAGVLYALGREEEIGKFIGGAGVKTPAGDGRMVLEDVLKPIGELPRLGKENASKALIWIFDNGRVYRMGEREFTRFALDILIAGRDSINVLIDRIDIRSSLAKATIRHIDRSIEMLSFDR